MMWLENIKSPFPDWMRYDGMEEFIKNSNEATLLYKQFYIKHEIIEYDDEKDCCVCLG